MDIGEEIQQEKFKSERHKAIINLLFSGNFFFGHYTRLLKSYGISVPQYNILRILKGEQGNPTSMNSLIDRMIHKMSNASRLVDKLEANRYASRTEQLADRRAVDIRITARGLELLNIIDENEKSFGDPGTLSEAEARQLNYLLNKMRLINPASDTTQVESSLNFLNRPEPARI